MDAINDWENQALTHRNRLAPHADFMGYETADLAATYSRELSRGFVQLSGSWQFRLFEEFDHLHVKRRGRMANID